MTDSKHPRRDRTIALAVRGVLGLGSHVPLALSRPLGAALGAAAMALDRRDRARARAHLRIAFPEATERDLQRLLWRCARHFGLMLAEVSWLWRATTDDLCRLCSLEGLEHLLAAREGGRGVVLTTGHCGNWEILNARLAAAGIPLTVAVRGLDDPLLDATTTALRRRFDSDVVPRGPAAGRRLVAALARNRVAGLLIDQDIRDVPGVFVPFFGRPAWTPSGGATLALRLGCSTLPTFIHRRPDLGHHVVVLPPIPPPGEGSEDERVTALVSACTAAIEDQIRAHPEQWVWMHRRWRTRPEDVTMSDGASG